MRKRGDAVEADMVPMIDIISLLLMFLIIVGDTASNASSVRMQLPRGMDQAMTEPELIAAKLLPEGRIVIELAPTEAGKYRAVMNGRTYDLADGGNGTLIAHLEHQINLNLSIGNATRNNAGAIDTPVRLRIPESAEMRSVESLILILARVGLVNVQYAADGKR